MSKKLKVILALVLVVLFCIFSYYYYVGNNFGIAVRDFSEDYINLREDLFDTIPTMTDTVYNQFKADVDTLLKLEKLK